MIRQALILAVTISWAWGLASVSYSQGPTLKNLQGAWEVSGQHLEKPYILEFVSNGYLIMRDGTKVEVQGSPDAPSWKFDGTTIAFDGYNIINDIKVGGKWKVKKQNKDQIDVTDEDGKSLKLKWQNIDQ